MMAKPGYKETLEFEGREWTPAEIRQEVRRTLQRGPRLSRESYWRVMTLVNNMELWLDNYVREPHGGNEVSDQEGRGEGEMGASVCGDTHSAGTQA